MAIRQTLLAATMLAAMLGNTLVAGEYIVEISATEGTVFGGTCVLITADNGTSHVVSGSTPITLQFSGDIISCAVQSKAGPGNLRMVIKNAAGHVVAESSKVLPFGVVIAAGR